MARKSYDEMTGDALREIGVLILVFAILDKLIAGKFSFGWNFSAILVSAAFFLAGCFLERSRVDE